MRSLSRALLILALLASSTQRSFAQTTPSISGGISGNVGGSAPSLIPPITPGDCLKAGAVFGQIIDAATACGGSGGSLANGKIWIGNALNVAVPVTPSGDFSITSLGIATVSSFNGGTTFGTAAGVNLGTGVATALGNALNASSGLVGYSGALGTPSSGVATNLTGTAAGLTAGSVTTNANLTGPITSTGNATAVASQTGTGSTFVMNASPTITSPTLVGNGSLVALFWPAGAALRDITAVSTDAFYIDVPRVYVRDPSNSFGTQFSVVNNVVSVPGDLSVTGATNMANLTASSGVFTDSSKNLTSTPPTGYPASAGTGIAISAGAINSNAVEHISYQPGLLTAVNATKAAFHKYSKAATVDNIEGSAATFSCVSNPTITMFECGTSSTCASSPVTIGTVTVTASGTVIDGTVSNPAITAGDYVAFSMTAGTCASVDVAATAQVHSN